MSLVVVELIKIICSIEIEYTMLVNGYWHDVYIDPFVISWQDEKFAEYLVLDIVELADDTSKRYLNAEGSWQDWKINQIDFRSRW